MGKRSTETISYNMSRIRSRGTILEDKLETLLIRTGLTYEKQYRVFGKPDFVLLRHKVAIFADSNFWHGYNWNEAKEQIKSNKEFWTTKIERNIQRDKEVNVELERLGWQVVRCWEHEIEKDPQACIDKIKRAYKKSGKK